MKITSDLILSGTVAFGVTSFTIYKFIDIHNKKKAAKAIDSLADHVNLDLNDPYLKEYVEKAVDQEVQRAVKVASRDIVSEKSCAIRSEVCTEVERQKAILAGSVKTAIANKVGELSIDDIRENAVKDAKQMAADKLREDMDDILDNYKQGLDNMVTIYRAISEKAAKAASVPGLSFDISM